MQFECKGQGEGEGQARKGGYAMAQEGLFTCARKRLSVAATGTL